MIHSPLPFRSSHVTFAQPGSKGKRQTAFVHATYQSLRPAHCPQFAQNKGKIVPVGLFSVKLEKLVTDQRQHFRNICIRKDAVET